MARQALLAVPHGIFGFPPLLGAIKGWFNGQFLNLSVPNVIVVIILASNNQNYPSVALTSHRGFVILYSSHHLGDYHNWLSYTNFYGDSMISLQIIWNEIFCNSLSVKF
jgi:hypothetical protein